MRRREFMTLLGGASVAWPLAARAQRETRMRRIGALIGTGSDEGQARLAGFRQQLQDLGWSEGHNIVIEERWGEGDIDRTTTSARELVSEMPDVLLAGSVRALTALKNATAAIPIVFVATSDPVGQGFVASLARPGGNITGFSLFEFSLAGKFVEILKEIAPSVTRGMLVCSPDNPSFQGYMRSINAVAGPLAMQVSTAPIHDAADVERLIAAFAGEPNGGLLVAPDVTANIQRDLIIALAAKYHLPAIYPYRFFADAGGLASYGVDLIDLYRRAAQYVDRILKGENPAELPVQAPSKFEFVINLKTVKALGLDVPAALLARADEVIE
jgi:putative tryptophan/tyrosine transport system substrate-binding protein